MILNVLLNEMKTDQCDQVIRNFASFLTSSFSYLDSSLRLVQDRAIDYQDENFEDWAQANWELLVERVLLGQQEYLVEYGSGSDYECEIHSRVFFRDSVATHYISVLTENGEYCEDVLNDKDIVMEGYRFDRFVSMKESWYYDTSPFDHVLMEKIDGLDNESAVVRMGHVLFGVAKI